MRWNRESEPWIGSPAYGPAGSFRSWNSAVSALPAMSPIRCSDIREPSGSMAPRKVSGKKKKSFWTQRCGISPIKQRNIRGEDCKDRPGAGAAGGLGFAFLSYFPRAELLPGAELVMEAAGFQKEIAKADVLVTGEGRLDGQTAMGKAPAAAARLAKRYGKKVIAFAGQIGEDAGVCNQAGIDAFFSILPGIMPLEEAMRPERAAENLARTAEQVFRLL